MKRESEHEVAYYWYMKGVHDSETTDRQPVSLYQTMKDFETHFYLQYKPLVRNKGTNKTFETEIFVDSFIQANGFPPTYSEIVDHFNLKSKSAAFARCRHFRFKMIRKKS